jgi:hypothetical protein
MWLIGHKTYLRRYKCLSERLEIRFICQFWSIPLLLIRIRIRIPNTDPDSGEPNQCGSMRIRIHNNGFSESVFK